MDSQKYADQKIEVVAKVLNQSKVLLASRLPKYNLAQQKQRSNLCITTQNGRNTTKYQIFLRKLIRKYSRKGKKWQPRLFRQMNAVFNTCFPLLINDLEIIDLRGLLPLRREKGTSILFIFYMINANYVGKFPHSLKSSKKVMFEIGDSKYISTNEPLITFSIATPSGGPLFRTQINGTISEIVRANSTECEDYL